MKGATKVMLAKDAYSLRILTNFHMLLLLRVPLGLQRFTIGGPTCHYSQESSRQNILCEVFLVPVSLSKSNIERV